jgi:predicted DNA-binding protein (UPF0251 family)
MSAISLERDYMLATENCKPSLTSTQALILTDLTHGVTIKEIAYARHIKRRTVSQHITDARARLDADAAAKYGELVDRAAKRESEYQTRIDTLNARIVTVEAKQGELEIAVRAANYRAAKFEDWAKRLAFQVQSYGGVPVLLDPEATRPQGKVGE